MIDTKQGPDAVVQRVIDGDDTEAQRFTRRAVPDADPKPERVVNRTVEDDDDDTEGQKATHR